MMLFGTIHLRKLVSSLALTLGTGLLAGYLSGSQGGIYGALNQPPLAPPGWVFGAVWTVLYILMGVSLYLVRTTPGEHGRAETVFALQLLINFFWPILFFALGWYCFSVLWLILLILAVALTVWLFYQVNKTAAWLLVPYFVWCLFALYLNIGVCILN